MNFVVHEPENFEKPAAVSRMRSRSRSVSRSAETSSIFELTTKPEQEEREDKAARTIQQAARAWKLGRIIGKSFGRVPRLHRKNLEDRLAFEMSILTGSIRLLNLCIIYVLITATINLSDDVDVKRGIHQAIYQQFDIEAVKKLSSREDFESYVWQLAGKSKIFSAHSSRYFDANRGELELVHEFEYFKDPLRLGGTSVEFDADTLSYTLTAWVALTTEFDEGYLLRKQVGSSEATEEYSCWGWHLSALHGPAFHYGAHDFFPSDAYTSAYKMDGACPKQVYVELPDGGTRVPSSKVFLMTVVVTQSEFLFYQDTELLGRVPSPRPVTECLESNVSHGLLIGARGLSIGQLRFYPFELNRMELEEIYSEGSILSDIGRNVVMRQPLETPTEVSQFSLEYQLGQHTESISSMDKEMAEFTLLMVDTDQRLKEAHPELSDEDHSGGTSLPYGALPVDPKPVADPNLQGREYISLLPHSYILSAPSAPNETNRYFDPETMPSFNGTGATFALWYRHPHANSHIKSHDITVSKGGGYILTAQLATSAAEADPEAACWSVYLDAEKIRLEYGGRSDFVSIPHTVLSEQFALGHLAWRHLAWQYDAEDDHFRFYVDGELAFEEATAIPVSEVGCAVKGNGTVGSSDTAAAEVVYVAVGHQAPRWDEASASTAEIADLRMYCVTEAADVGGWVDTFGNGCAWYHHMAHTFPDLCLLPAAMEYCPVVCHAVQECFHVVEDSPVHRLWDRIRWVDVGHGVHDQGNLCLKDTLTKDQVLEQCRQAAAEDHTEDRERSAWHAYLTQAKEQGFSRLNVTDCEQLEIAIDPYCAFNASAVEHFAKDVAAHGGDYTIYFWARPVGETSFDHRGKFQPSITIYSDIAPVPSHPLIRVPQSKITTVAFSKCTPDSETCASDHIEPDILSHREWSFIALSLHTKNNHTETILMNNLDFEKYQDDDLLQFDSDTENNRTSRTFSYIEFNTEMLLSPVSMVPRAMKVQELQHMYYMQHNDIAIRMGPTRRNRERVEHTIHVDKKKYLQITALIAPALLFQTRSETAEECPYEFSNKWLDEQLEITVDQSCHAPHHCDEEVKEDPMELMRCRGGSSQAPFFGLGLTTLSEKIGVADFLNSITENVYLHRGDDMLATHDFIDSLTEVVTVEFAFYSPQYGISSLLSIHGTYTGSQEVTVISKLQHYEIIEGQSLIIYLLAQGTVLFFAGLLFCDNMLHFARIYKKCRRGKKVPSVQSLFIPLLDLTIISVLIYFLAIRTPSKINTKSKTEEIIGGLASIPWSDTSMQPHEKKDYYFEMLSDWLVIIEEEEEINTFCSELLIMLMLRIIVATACHPRLAILTGTILHALDDLFHTCILVAMLIFGFARVANWRFGHEREEFATFTTSMETLLEMALGNFVVGWSENQELAIFTVLFCIVMFILILNFILAIIVEAYMQVRRENDELVIEQNFFRDVHDSVVNHLAAIRYGWPWPSQLAGALAQQPAKLTIGFDGLMKLADEPEDDDVPVKTACFSRGSKGVFTFMHWYSQYQFLRPQEITLRPKEQKELIDGVEERIAKLLGLPCRSLTSYSHRNSNMSHTISDRMAMQSSALYTLQERMHGKETGSIDGRKRGEEGRYAPPAEVPLDESLRLSPVWV
ncbi:hypothetical protein CYMTET_8782 [Cymbomonas tetramitiformis]|uniref:Polycystin cation channel PKD1/PKD2 domain-containing protein n=1 Tax=Cymbomonas tetramitiformis TaxID=36881 RepID=A0AAE0GSL8_9CHLO|nr:hypothetical protein CYMTET_8782 [Cymbomonas tetramitiformis]